MTFNYKTALAAIALTVAATSCSDNDNDWQPGETVPETMTVYFEQMPTYSYTFNADDSHIIPVTISRANYTEAASVPLEVTSCPEGVELPQTIDFEAGQKSVVLDIDCANMPSKTTGDIIMTLDPAYTSIYGAGAQTLSLSVTVTGSWIVFAERVKIKFSEKFSTVYSDLYILEGTTQFKFENFLNSGTDFVFTLGEKQSNNRRYIEPVRNFIPASVADDNEDDEGWYFYNDAIADYPVMYPNNTDLGITDMYFYGGSQNSYNYINLTSGSGQLYYVWCTYTDDTSGYQTIKLTLSPLFDPYATEE